MFVPSTVRSEYIFLIWQSVYYYIGFCGNWVISFGQSVEYIDNLSQLCG
jgi:hypothetical protein